MKIYIVIIFSHPLLNLQSYVFKTSDGAEEFIAGYIKMYPSHKHLKTVEVEINDP